MYNIPQGTFSGSNLNWQPAIGTSQQGPQNLSREIPATSSSTTFPWEARPISNIPFQPVLTNSHQPTTQKVSQIAPTIQPGPQNLSRGIPVASSSTAFPLGTHPISNIPFQYIPTNSPIVSHPYTTPSTRMYPTSHMPLQPVLTNSAVPSNPYTIPSSRMYSSSHMPFQAVPTNLPPPVTLKVSQIAQPIHQNLSRQAPPPSFTTPSTRTSPSSHRRPCNFKPLKRNVPAPVEQKVPQKQAQTFACSEEKFDMAIEMLMPSDYLSFVQESSMEEIETKAALVSSPVKRSRTEEKLPSKTHQDEKENAPPAVKKQRLNQSVESSHCNPISEKKIPLTSAEANLHRWMKDEISRFLDGFQEVYKRRNFKNISLVKNPIIKNELEIIFEHVQTRTVDQIRRYLRRWTEQGEYKKWLETKKEELALVSDQTPSQNEEREKLIEVEKAIHDLSIPKKKSRWDEKDKELLKKALESCPIDDYKAISAFMGNRSVDQVRTYMKRKGISEKYRNRIKEDEKNSNLIPPQQNNFHFRKANLTHGLQAQGGHQAIHLRDLLQAHPVPGPMNKQPSTPSAYVFPFDHKNYPSVTLNNQKKIF